MAFQPKLNRSTPEMGKIEYTLFHSVQLDPSARAKIDEAHIHTCYEIYVNVTGDVSFLHGSRIFDILPYDIIFSAPGELHHCIYHPDLPHEHYCLWFFGECDFLKSNDISRLSGHIRLDEAGKSRLSQLVGRLESELSDIEETICLLSIISLISGKEKSLKAVSHPTESRVNKILDYVDEHISEIRSVSEIADAFYLSVSSLNRILREETSLSPKKLLEAKRMTEAERLLREGVSVTEVCYTVGFGDLSRFISKFKRKFGITPNRYKNLNQKAK